MKLSARNQLIGKILSVTRGAVNSEITIEITPGVTITSIITNSSSESLGLKEGAEAYAVVKASNVMVAVD